MKTVISSPPELDLRSWQPSSPGRELALLLPDEKDCLTVLYDVPDAVDVECWLVTHLDVREGKRYRWAVECQLLPELVVDDGHYREDEEVEGAWLRGEGASVGSRDAHWGLLSEASPTRLVYGGVPVTPIEGCVGVDLRGCPNETLMPWQECRMCDKTALFFRPRPLRQLRSFGHGPICSPDCPTPPHSELMASLGDLGLWRRRSPETANPMLFADAATCAAEASSRARRGR